MCATVVALRHSLHPERSGFDDFVFFCSIDSKITFCMEIAAYCSSWNFNFFCVCEEWFFFWLYGHCDGYLLWIEQPNANIHLKNTNITKRKSKRNGIDSFQSADYNWWKTRQIRSKWQLPFFAARCHSCKFCIHNAIRTNDGVDLIHKYGSFTMCFFDPVLNRRIRFIRSLLRLHHFDVFVFDMIFHCLLAGKKMLLILLNIETDYRLYAYIAGTTNSIVEHFIGCLTLSRFERTSTLHLSVLYIDWNCYCCCCRCCCCWKVMMFSISICGNRQLVRHIDAIGLKWPLAWCHVEIWACSTEMRVFSVLCVRCGYCFWLLSTVRPNANATIDQIFESNGSNSYRSHDSLTSWAISNDEIETVNFLHTPRLSHTHTQHGIRLTTILLKSSEF